MNTIKSAPARKVAAAVLANCFGAALLFAGVAQAQERHDRRHASEPYHSPHWIYDNRYRHGHYYPALGYTVDVLPPGYLSLTFGSRHLFLHGGVWFAAAGPRFAVLRPPIGIVVPVLPPAYATVWAGGIAYYYANETYYEQAPGGSVVVAPPAGVAEGAAPPAAPFAAPPAAPPPAAPSAAAPQPPGGTWYYCDSARAYYPYVTECREGWRQVPATPPPAR